MERQEDKFKTLILLGGILALLGAGLSIYSLMHHLELKQLGHTSFACNINETMSCDDIANSRFAEDPWGNPMGIYGVGYFLGLFALLLTARAKLVLRRDIVQTYAVMVGLGVLVSVVLLGISEFIIGKICPTCVGVYLVTLLQAVILGFSRGAIPLPWSLKGIINGGWYAIATLLLAIAAFQVMKPESHRNFKADLPTMSQEAPIALEQRINGGGEPPILASLDRAQSPSIKIDFSAYSGLGEDYRLGSDESKVKIVEFADFQCPSCAGAARVLENLAAEMGNKILIVFKNFPLDSTCNTSLQTKMHPFACEAATIVRCAGTIGKFWELNHRVYSNQKDIDSTRLLAWAKDVGLNDAQIKQCLSSPDLLKKLQDDVKQANEAGLTGTPTLFINGRRYNGPMDLDNLKMVVQALLER